MSNKFIIIFSLIFILVVNGFTEDVNRYHGSLIKSIPYGDNKGELGFSRGVNPDSPGEMLVADSKIFINDRKNKRINLYDLQLNLLDQISLDNENLIKFSSKIKVDMSGNFYGRTIEEFVKSDSNGNMIYYIPNSKLPKKFIDSGQYWIYDEYVIFYSEVGVINAINPTGELIWESEDTKFLNNIPKGELYNRYKTDVDLYLFSNKLLMLENKLLSQNFKEYCDFWSLFGRNDIYEKYSRAVYFGHDSEDNSYWMLRPVGESGSYWYCFSPMGKQLDRFLIDVPAYEVVLAPNGDIYAKINNQREKRFEFYLVDRPLAVFSVDGK